MSCPCTGGGCGGCYDQRCTCMTTARSACGPSAYSRHNCNSNLTFINEQALAADAVAVSAAFHTLSTALAAQTVQVAVLITQKALLVAVMKMYNCYTTDPAKLFDRDDAINGIKSAIATSVGLLSANQNYAQYQTMLTALNTAIDAYFTTAQTPG